MRSHSITYSREIVEPSWLSVLRQQLAGGGDDGRADLLMLTAALDEVACVAHGVRRDHGQPWAPTWRSLLADVEHARQAMGAALEAHVRDSWKRLWATLQTSSAPEDSAAAESLLAELDRMRAVLLEPASRQTAWDDVLAAHRDDSPPEVSEARIRLLAALMTAAGHDWKTSRAALAGAVNDNLFDLHQIGYSSADDRRSETLTEPAGVSLHQRLTLCRDYVASAPETPLMAAWVAYENAFLPEQYCRLGPVELWDGSVYPDGVIKGWWSEGKAPPELRPQGNLFLPQEEDLSMVLVRVDLGRRPIAGAAEAAQALVETMVEVARANSAWAPMDGIALVANGQFFGSRIRRKDERMVPRRDGTGTFIRRISSDLVRDLAEQEPNTRDVAADVTWQKSIARLPDSTQRCALAVRLLERRLPDVGRGQDGSSGWTANAHWWLRAVWARERTFQQLVDAAYEIADGWHPRDQASVEQQRRFRDLMLSGNLRGIHTIDRRAILLHLPEAVEHVPTYYMAHRIVRWMASETSDGTRVARHIENCMEQFDRLLARARRVRNAVLHGNDTEPAVVASVEPFLGDLCHILISQQLHALRERSTLAQVLEEDRDRCLQALTRLHGGEASSRALFDD